MMRSLDVARDDKEGGKVGMRSLHYGRDDKGGGRSR